jgi:tRNA(Ile2)-agmatinylcytidine synthase
MRDRRGRACVAPALLAFDDTDGPLGGCTTHLAFQVLLALPDVALAGMPRLVRLNPNIPWKTRGNGAVVLPLARPEGPSVRVGELRGHEVLAFPDGRPPTDLEGVLERAWQVVAAQAQEEARPAVAVARDPPPPAAYWQAARTLVQPDEARSALDAFGSLWRSHADGRALAGSLGALAWPGPAASYEFIAYRHPSVWGTPRQVAPEALARLDEAGATFHTADPDTGRPVCVPHGPDPVLFGLRGRDADVLLATAMRAAPLAAREPIDGWLLWATNQASGDHVTPVEAVGEAPELGTVLIRARIDGMPETRAGGHVFVPAADSAGARLVLAAFEPTKGLREAVRLLRPGDGVEAVGAAREGVLNLEKLNVLTVAEHRVKADNPRCPTCGKGMKSAGQGQGFRCRDCGTRVGPDAGGTRVEDRAGLVLGWHEPPVGARRHLHRPAAWDA